jgi:hypothetical protein
MFYVMFIVLQLHGIQHNHSSLTQQPYELRPILGGFDGHLW